METMLSLGLNGLSGLLGLSGLYGYTLNDTLPYFSRRKPQCDNFRG